MILGELFSLSRQILLYGAVGGIGTLGHYLVLGLLVEVAGSGPVIASSLGFIVGALVNHELSRLLVFPATCNNRRTTLLCFMVIASLGFLVNLGVMALATALLDMHYFAAQLMATGSVFVMTFTLNKVWTFGP